MNFLSQRRVTLTAFVLTAALFIYSFTLQFPYTEYLNSDYSITPAGLQWFYGGMLVLTALAFTFEPIIRRELRESRALPLVIGIGLVISVISVWQLVPNQPQRFVRPVMAMSAWVAYVVMLCGLAVLLAVNRPQAALTPRMQRYAIAFLLLIIVVMGAAHVASIGHFALLDDVFDELWAASSMANYALNGDFSPALGGSPYGSPDPAVTRWFMLNAWWAQLRGSTDFFVLRETQVMAAFVMAGIVAVTLWREPSLTHVGRLAGLTVLLSLSTFTRTAHNLRMDIGFGVYGALVLLFLLEYLRGHHWRWLALMGASLYVAMETIPTMGLIYAACIGLLVIWQSWQRQQWRHVFIYTGACAGACFVYVLVHFAPDFASKFAQLQRFTDIYTATNSVTVGIPHIVFSGLHRFVFALSPVELIVIYGALIGLFIVAKPHERGLLAVFAGTQALTATFIGGSLGYQVVFAPLIAYVVARVMLYRGEVLLTVFVMLPALAAAPLHDLWAAWHGKQNQQLIAELDLLTWRVPEGATVVGDDLFWLTLHDKARFIGHSGVKYYQHGNDLAQSEVLPALQPEMVICNPDLDAVLCDLAVSYFDDEPEEFAITHATYLIYTKP